MEKKIYLDIFIWTDGHSPVISVYTVRSSGKRARLDHRRLRYCSNTAIYISKYRSFVSVIVCK